MFPVPNLLADEASGLFFPESASSFSQQSDTVFYAITIVCVLFFIPITIALFGFASKYKKAKGEQAESQVDHNTKLELIWSVGPSFLLIAMFYFGARGFMEQRTIPEGAYEIGVKAARWNWSFNYGGTTQNSELHVVKDEPTKLVMQADTVIHSLFIPAFRVKKDVVPGRFNYMWFRATKASEKLSDEELAARKQVYKDASENWSYEKEGYTEDGYAFYDLYCTEYCGKDHSMMQTVVVVHETRDELEAWVEEKGKRQPGVDPVTYGRKLYESRGCKSCHSLEPGVKLAGPSYAGSYGTSRELTDGSSVIMDYDYIKESIEDPKAKIVKGYAGVNMPSYKGMLSTDDIYCLAQFIKSLNPNAAKQEAEEADSGAAEAEKGTEADVTSASE